MYNKNKEGSHLHKARECVREGEGERGSTREREREGWGARESLR